MVLVRFSCSRFSCLFFAFTICGDTGWNCFGRRVCMILNGTQEKETEKRRNPYKVVQDRIDMVGLARNYCDSVVFMGERKGEERSGE